MSNLSISFASLVKNNNGLFKSEKQADFLLSRCNGNTYETSGRVGRSSFYMDYFCDEQGIIKVTKRTDKKGTVLTWERREDGKLAIQDKKEIASIKRTLKQEQQSLISASNYAWADPEMGIEVVAARKSNVEFMINRLLELGVTV